MQNHNLNAILPVVIQQFDRWNRKISTTNLNMWVRQLTRLQPPPRINGRPTKIRFLNQTHTRPPHFGLFFSASANLISESYVRFLTNSLRDEFDVHGVPIRVTVKKSRNPFADEKIQQEQTKSKRID